METEISITNLLRYYMYIVYIYQEKLEEKRYVQNRRDETDEMTDVF